MASALTEANRKRLAIVILAVALLAAGGWLRAHFSTEAVIGRAMRGLATSAEDEKLLSVARGISRRYSDPRGMTYESFLGGLHDLFESHQEIRVPISIRSVSVSGTTAAVELSFKLQATPTGGGQRQWLIGSTLESARARLLVRLEAGSWKLETVEALDLAGARF